MVFSELVCYQKSIKHKKKTKTFGGKRKVTNKSSVTNHKMLIFLQHIFMLSGNNDMSKTLKSHKFVKRKPSQEHSQNPKRHDINNIKEQQQENCQKFLVISFSFGGKIRKQKSIIRRNLKVFPNKVSVTLSHC